MFLSNLSIENYRAIKSADLTFNSTTYWVGENESGKTSLIEALSKLLNADRGSKAPVFVRSHFHHSEKTKEPIGPIKIKLTFEERKENEWLNESYEPIFHLFAPKNNLLRKLELEVKAEPILEGTVEASWELRSVESGKKTSDPQLLKWVREKCPVINLAAGMLTGKGVRNIPLIDPPLRNKELPEKVIDQIITIQGAASALLTKNTTSLTTEINKGFNAAKELFNTLTENSKTKNLGLTQKVGEILGKSDDNDNNNTASFSPQSGNNSQKLGALLLIAALLRASPEGLSREMEPIWIIENPEAYLHPMTLASVTFLINQIKWQKIVITYSSNLISNATLKQIRRIVRYHGEMREYKIDDSKFSREDVRKISYHLRTRHGVSIFSRLWLLVEGETEFWIMPQLARLIGYDLDLEGVRCVDFAQSGLASIIKLAKELGIKWHMLTDGDNAGNSYSKIAKHYLEEGGEEKAITILKEKDIENCFYYNGYADIYKKFARLDELKNKKANSTKIIHMAIKLNSKPFLALAIAEAAAEQDSPGIPYELVGLIRQCVKRAREAPF